MSVRVEKISEEKFGLGEGPFWDEESQSLFFVDIPKSSVCRYSSSTKELFTAVVGDKSVNFIIPIEGQQSNFLISYGDEIAKIIWDGVSNKIESMETVAKLPPIEGKKCQFNDAKADQFGRLWVGSIVTGDSFTDITELGGVYMLKSDNTLKQLTTGIQVANGLAWNKEMNKFYFIDSFNGVLQFDYDPNSSEISNKELIFKFGGNEDPDGMTMDTDGNLWIAMFNGGKVVKIDPRKPNSILQTVTIPVQQPTSAVFGGPNHDELYVTSASLAFKVKEAPEGGWTFKVTNLGVKGVVSQKVKFT